MVIINRKSQRLLSDEQLLDEIAKRKNKIALEQFYKRHAALVHAFVFRRLQNKAAADEVTNDTMFQVWLSAAQFAKQSSVKTWLLGIAKHKAQDKWRGQGRVATRESEWDEHLAETTPDETACVFTQLLAKQQGQHLHFCYALLSQAQQSCIHLSIVEGLKQHEIAQVLEIPANTVATRLHHAKRKLRDCMQNMFGEGAL